MNNFSEGADVVDLGRQFQRDDTLLEKKFKDELILFIRTNLGGRTSSRIIQISLQ